MAPSQAANMRCSLVNARLSRCSLWMMLNLHWLNLNSTFTTSLSLIFSFRQYPGIDRVDLCPCREPWGLADMINGPACRPDQSLRRHAAHSQWVTVVAPVMVCVSTSDCWQLFNHGRMCSPDDISSHWDQLSWSRGEHCKNAPHLLHLQASSPPCPHTLPH